jgi:hypothetical protein
MEIKNFNFEQQLVESTQDGQPAITEQLRELAASELMLVGGGGTDVVFG